MEIETGAVGRVFRQVPGARPHRENPADDLQGLSQRGDVGVWAEVPSAWNRDPPDDQHARERLGERHGNLRITLIIAQPNVELRLVLLDQRVLEQQCLCFVRHDDRLEIGDLFAQRFPLDAALFLGEVVGDARAEVRGLADIHDLPGGVFPHVDAGASGKSR